MVSITHEQNIFWSKTISANEKDEKINGMIIGLTLGKRIKFTTCELLATLFGEEKKIKIDFGVEPFMKIVSHLRKQIVFFISSPPPPTPPYPENRPMAVLYCDCARNDHRRNNIACLQESFLEIGLFHLEDQLCLVH